MSANNISRKIYERRTELGITQREIANHVGVTEATVSRWESGDINNMRRNRIEKLAEILRVSPLYIMGIEPYPDAKSREQTQFTTDQLEIVDAYNNLNDTGKRALVTVLAALKNTYPKTQLAAAL